MKKEEFRFGQNVPPFPCGGLWPLINAYVVHGFCVEGIRDRYPSIISRPPTVPFGYALDAKLLVLQCRGFSLQRHWFGISTGSIQTRGKKNHATYELNRNLGETL